MRARDRLRALVAGREPVPDGFAGTLATGERVIADARDPRGAVVLATDRGLWLPPEHGAGRSWTADSEDGPEGGARRIPWHLVSKATWSAGALVVVEAVEDADLGGGVVLLADRPGRRVSLPEPGQLPEVVRQRVTDAIKDRQYHELPGGGAWFVQRRVPGVGVVIQVRPDPGTDPGAVHTVAAGVGERLRAARHG